MILIQGLIHDFVFEILNFIIVGVCCLCVHRHGPHIWLLIVKAKFQIQSHELSPVLKSFIHMWT
jgi:hypothetical protein